MVLLGVDPGLAATGWGVVRRAGARYECLGYGCVRTRADAELGARLRQIHESVLALVREHEPAVMVIEQLYQLRDGSTGLSVGQAVGVVRLAAAQLGLPLAAYSPTHVKLTLVGNGQAEKHQVQFMVQRLLNLDTMPRPDHAADALALCICHVHSGLSRAAGGDTGPSTGADRLAAALAADEERRREHRARETSRR